MHAIVSTFALTGGRQSEVLGLEVEDVSFDRGTVTFRPNEHRRLKTPKSARTVPLWPHPAALLIRRLRAAQRPPVPFPADGEMELTPVPVSLFTVAREMGHTSTRLIEKRYGHLLVNRQARSDVVEYRVKQHEEELGERLLALQLVG